MRDVLRILLARHGETAVLERAEPVEIRAFLQPLESRDETVPAGAVSAGLLDGRRWKYLGQTPLAPGEVLQWRGRRFRVRSVRPHAAGGAVCYWWAALEQEAT